MRVHAHYSGVMSRVVLVAALLVLSLVSCSDPGTPAESGRRAAPAAEVDGAGTSHARLVERLDRIDREARRNNFYLGDRLVRETRAELEGLKHLPIASRLSAQIPLAEYLLRLGEEREAIALLGSLEVRVHPVSSDRDRGGAAGAVTGRSGSR